MEQLLGQRDLIDGAPAHHGVLRIVGEHAANVGDRPHRRDDFLELLNGGDVFQIEHLHHLILIVAAFGDVVFRHENGVAADRFPERLGQHRDVVQRLVQRRVIQIQIHVLAGSLILRIEDHVYPGQLAHGLVQNPRRLIIHLQRANLVGDGLELRHGLQGCDAILRRFPLQIGRSHHLFGGRQASLLIPLDHLGGTPQFLKCYAGGWVHRKALLKFQQGVFQLPGIAQLLSRQHVRLSGLSPNPAHPHLIGGIVGILLQRQAVVLQRFLVILLALGQASLLQKLVALAAACQQFGLRAKQK